MRLTLPPLQVNPDDPFNPKDDIFGRKEFAERLSNLMLKLEDNPVISIDTQWGEGKTTFIKMFNAQLEKEGATTIYFDAFAHDYVDDAFTAITGEIYSKIKAKIPDKGTENKFPDIAKKFLSVAAKAGTKIALNKLGLEVEELKTIVDDTSDVVSKVIENKIEQYDKNKESIESFKTELSNLADAVKNEPPNEDKYPLIFIVDELDRCKPTYALEVIEKIKHFFSVKNVVFILVMNKKQIESSIKCIYGADIDASTYLQKFINIECALPKQSDKIKYKGRTSDDIERYCNYLYEKHELNKLVHNNEAQLNLILIAKIANLTLRDLERVYSYATLFYSTLNERMFKLYDLTAFLIMLKVKKLDIYKKLKNNELNYDELIKNESIKTIIMNDNSRNLKYILAFLLSSPPTPAHETIQYLPNILSTLRLSKEDVIPWHCQSIDSFEFID